VFGGSLVFMRIIRSGYETILKDPTQFFFLILFSFFQDPGRVSKICKKNFTQVSKHWFSDMWYQSGSKPVFAYLLLQILLSQKLIFNVQKFKFYTKNENSKNKIQHFVYPLFHLVQMNLQIILTPLQNLNLFQLTLLNWKAVYIHF
jgi:hypothetical protein